MRGGAAVRVGVWVVVGGGSWTGTFRRTIGGSAWSGSPVRGRSEKSLSCGGPMTVLLS